MDVLAQILCIIISFGYGIFINMIIQLNNMLLKKMNFIFNLFFRLVFTFVLVIFYIILIYKVNLGIFHIYFILLISIGYVLGFKFNVSKYVKKFLCKGDV